jgi:ATP synthase protein I
MFLGSARLSKGAFTMIDPADKARLDALTKRIDAVKQANAPEPKVEDHHTQAGMAWRMVTELVVGLLVGFGIGYGLDALFGTRPIFLVLFILLGFAAGVRVMLRSATEMQKDMVAAAAAQGIVAKDLANDEEEED